MLARWALASPAALARVTIIVAGSIVGAAASAIDRSASDHVVDEVGDLGESKKRPPEQMFGGRCFFGETTKFFAFPVWGSIQALSRAFQPSSSPLTPRQFVRLQTAFPMARSRNRGGFLTRRWNLAKGVGVFVQFIRNTTERNRIIAGPDRPLCVA
jgi:hypothetical protein